MNTSELNQLSMYFIEAKWLRNAMLASNDISNFCTKKSLTAVMGLDKNKQPESKPITFLPPRFRQAVKEQINGDIKSLAKKKQNGYKTGKLNFVSEVNSINLPQYNNSWKVIGKKAIHVQGFKRNIKVHGLHQLNDFPYQLSNAKLLKKSSGYYLKVTCFIDKNIYQESKPKIPNKVNVGLDFGIKTTLTTSDGDKFNISIKETDTLKKKQQAFSRKMKGSHNRYKDKLSIRKQYEHLANQRKDMANKIVSTLLGTYDTIFLQDENIRGWHRGLFGKQVQHSALGTIKQQLINKGAVLLEQKAPTTKECYKCHERIMISLSERVFCCTKCGHIEERDIKSAKTALYYGENRLYISKKNKYKKLLTERKDVPAKEKACGDIIRPVISPVGQLQAFVHEAGSSDFKPLG